MAKETSRYLIIGTAGHVDHGKTTLIGALTGMQTDRHPEERARGMSIDLGFAHITLPSGTVAGIVDVPGHERFVHNMLAGASEMDLVLLLVAADEGVMPQTREHLAILDLLGTKRGIIVVTKVDIVDADWLELVKDDIRTVVRGTFLENAPIVEVSAVTGQGLDNLLAVMDAGAADVPPKDTDRPFRLPIDDIFVKAGFGTIARGAIFSGTISVGQEVIVQPQGFKARVRSLHTYGRPVERAFAGQRAAMNLTGLEREDIKRGDVIVSEVPLKVTDKIVVQLRVLPAISRPIRNGVLVHFHHATSERMAILNVPERKTLTPGEETCVMFHLNKPIACAWGDRVIIRALSPLTTIAGGVIVDMNGTATSGRKQQPSSWSEKGQSPISYLIALIHERSDGVTVGELTQRLFLNPSAIQLLVHEVVARGDAKILSTGTLLSTKWLEDYKNRIVRQLNQYHQERPLRRGLSKEGLRSLVGSQIGSEDFESLLAELSRQGTIVIEREVVRLPDHSVRLSADQESLAQMIERKCRQAKFAPLEVSDVLSLIPDREQPMDFISFLIESGRLVRVSDFLYHPETIQEAINLAQQLAKEGGSFTAAQFRDAVATSRKYVVPLLEYLDHLGITVRRGDVRILKGQQ
ncbi:MAG: selenocysteine-specific translation elongation factor [Armatimonadetes bacterium]|nr:selenocysteine-specific translation elongation factor [Armatimonadota bacterium]MDW8121605.1 selenocysteine-specific translation elongation factor [Armatimonadota bacterium]